MRKELLYKVVDGVVIALVIALLLINISGYIFHKPIVAVVKGISMEPLLHTGDIVIINPLDERPKLGQVIVYVNDVGEYVIHRVVAIIDCSNGQKLYVTKGDNDPIIDPEDIAVMKSVGCRVRSVHVLNKDVAQQVYECLRGLPRSDIVGVVLQVHDAVVKIFGLSPCIG
ncbi:MAG: signal peptidase I [Crenarchaeota archaeon]|nr:signal peptidase I [Thermoproteota archaeon]